MTRDDAIVVLAEAASNWLVELENYVIPGADDEEVPGYRTSADLITEALLEFQAEYHRD